MNITNNLYPPIINTYMPAFLINSGNIEKDICKVYFSLSDFNSITEIKNIQVTIVDQNTNITVLDEEKYPCGIMLTSLEEDTLKESDDKYFIKIKKDDINGGNFENNRYYKVQLRFTGINAEPVSLETPQAIDSWLTSNLSNFSEWSTVCLVRGISLPTLSIKGIDTSANYTVWNSSNVEIIGTLSFADKNETEILDNYIVKLYKNNDLIIQSEKIYTSTNINPNEINYIFNYMFEDGESYKIEILYETISLYQDVVSYNLMVVQGGTPALKAKMFSEEDVENGRIKIHILGDNTDKFTGNIMIRRTSSESNFTIWEDIHLIRAEQQLIDFIWYDSTVKSGVWYKYCAQEVKGNGQRSVVIKLKNPVMITLDHIYLQSGNKQLKVAFNPNISSFQRTVSEVKIDTLGSKYPFIKRNGYMNYKQFPLSGTISCFMDEDELFTTKEDIYFNSEEIKQLFEVYNDEERINKFNDYTYEREFREKVMDFLYDNNVKLFRSATEGNILVKLMNISFTPNVTLGRLIYNFSCTAYEIAEANISNYIKYNINTIEEYLNQYFSYDKKNYNQRYEEIVPKGVNVLDLLTQKAQENEEDGYISKVEYLDYLNLQIIDQKPSLLVETSDGPKLVSNVKNRNILGNYFTGYLVYVNDKPFVIPPEGIYELKNEGIKITSLIFEKDTKITLDYNSSIITYEDESTLPVAESFYNKMGQEYGIFNFQDSIYQNIWKKHYFNYSDFNQSIVSINSVNIEAEIGTVLYVKELFEKGFDRHIVGKTYRLNLADEAEAIEGIYFAGIHLTKASEAESKRIICPENKFIETSISVNNVEEIENPIRNGVYTIINSPIQLEYLEVEQETDKNKKEFYNFIENKMTLNRYIWFNDEWYIFDENNDVICPVPALIDYNFDLMRGSFN